jgi:DNA helicase MCM8
MEQQQRAPPQGQVAEAVPPSWNIYFPELRFAHDDRRAELVATLARFFSSEIGFELIRQVRGATVPDTAVDSLVFRLAL